MKAGYSIWLTNDDGERIFGLGPYKLLLLIDKHGSLNKAAKEINISYTKARDILIRAEQELHLTLLVKEIGGPSGGGSKLTREARDVIEKYEAYRRQSQLAIEKIFKDIYGN